MQYQKKKRELILLCSKRVHFNSDGVTYTQTNGVAIGSSLRPVLSGIFTTELQNDLIHDLLGHLVFLKTIPLSM